MNADGNAGNRTFGLCRTGPGVARERGLRHHRAMRTLAPALVFAIASAIAAFAPPEPARAQQRYPQPKLPTVRIEAGIHVIRAELADTIETRMLGLMGRESLGPNEGMLFVFEQKAVHCFWMRNTPLPLSIAFLDDDGGIVNIEQMAPRSDESHCPSRAVRFALEMEQGWFAKRGLQEGARLTLPASLTGQR